MFEKIKWFWNYYRRYKYVLVILIFFTPIQAAFQVTIPRLIEFTVDSRGEACSALGKMHSEFGRILPTKDVDGVAPYLDPLKPIPRDHIEGAAEKAGIRPDDIDAQVASLSAHLGWDVTRGAEKKG